MLVATFGTPQKNEDWHWAQCFSKEHLAPKGVLDQRFIRERAQNIYMAQPIGGHGTVHFQGGKWLIASCFHRVVAKPRQSMIHVAGTSV